jgi:hypothetical protein
MNIFACILLLFGLLSSWKIYRDSKKEGVTFSPYNSANLHTIGFSCGIAGGIILFIYNLHLIIMFFQVIHFMYNNNLIF